MARITLDLLSPAHRQELRCAIPADYELEASCLGDVFVHLRERFGISIEAGPGDRHFFLDRVGRARPAEAVPWVDVHVYRVDDWFCPKHDLQTELRDGDRVSVCQLIC